MVSGERIGELMRGQKREKDLYSTKWGGEEKGKGKGRNGKQLKGKK